FDALRVVLCVPAPPLSTLFPYTTLFRSAHRASSAAIAAAVGGRATPRSQTNAVISSAGVTSNAGLRTATSGSVTRSPPGRRTSRSEEHMSELQSRVDLVCRLLLEKKKNK